MLCAYLYVEIQFGNNGAFISSANYSILLLNEKFKRNFSLTINTIIE